MTEICMYRFNYYFIFKEAPKFTIGALGRRHKFLLPMLTGKLMIF